MADSEVEESKEDIVLNVRFGKEYPLDGLGPKSTLKDVKEKIKENNTLDNDAYILYNRKNKEISDEKSVIHTFAKFVKKKKRYIIEAERNIPEPTKTFGTLSMIVIVKVKGDDEYEYPSLDGASEFNELIKKIKENGDKYTLFDKNKKRILDTDAAIHKLAHWDQRRAQYIVYAEEAQEETDVGKEYATLPEEKEWELRKRTVSKASIKTSDAPAVGGGDATLEVIQVEDLSQQKKQRLFKGNRRLLYGRIPTESGIINADYRMFDLRTDIDWNNDNDKIDIKSYDVLFSDLSRSSQIIESTDSFSTSLAESCYVSAEVGIKAAGYGSVSIGAKHETNKSTEENNNYFSLTARSTINCAQILVNNDSVRYTQAFMDDLNELLVDGTTYLSHWKRFVQKYGFFYHDKARLGGTAYMSHISESSSTATTEEEKQEIKLEMEASYAFVSASASMAAGRSSSNSSTSTKSSSNKQLNCNGGRPDLCSFASFTDWESSLNDSRLWAVTEAISLKPFYHLLSVETKTRIFELVPGFKRFMERFKEKADQKLNLHPEVQISDFFGSDTRSQKAASFEDETKTKKNIFRAVEFVNNGLFPGLTLFIQPQAEDYQDGHEIEREKSIGYLNKERNKEVRIEDNDKCVIKFTKTEVINNVSIWMDPQETKIIGMQFVTNIGQKINVIPPLYTAMQLLDIKVDDSWQKQLKMEKWWEKLKAGYVLKMFNNIWQNSNKGWMDAEIVNMDETDKGLSLRMRWKDTPVEEEDQDNKRDIEEYDERIDIVYGEKNCLISAFEQNVNQRETVEYVLTSKLRDYWLYRVQERDVLRLKYKEWMEVEVIDRVDTKLGFKLTLAQLNVDDDERKETQKEIEILYGDKSANHWELLRPKKRNKNANIVLGSESIADCISFGDFMDLNTGEHTANTKRELRNREETNAGFILGYNAFPITVQGCHRKLSSDKNAYDDIVNDPSILNDTFDGKHWLKYMAKSKGEFETLKLSQDDIYETTTIVTYTAAANCVLWQISRDDRDESFRGMMQHTLLLNYSKPNAEGSLDKMFDLDEAFSGEYSVFVSGDASQVTFEGCHKRLGQSFDSVADLRKHFGLIKNEITWRERTSWIQWTEVVAKKGTALKWKDIRKAPDSPHSIISFTKGGHYVLWKIVDVKEIMGCDRIRIKSVTIDTYGMRIRSRIIYNKEKMSNLSLNVDEMKEFYGRFAKDEDEEKRAEETFSVESVAPTTFDFSGKHYELKQEFDDIVTNPQLLENEITDAPDDQHVHWMQYFEQNGKLLTKSRCVQGKGATFIVCRKAKDENVLWKIIEIDNDLIYLKSARIYKDLDSFVNDGTRVSVFDGQKLMQRNTEVSESVPSSRSDEPRIRTRTVIDFVVKVDTSTLKKLDGAEPIELYGKHVEITQDFDDVVRNPGLLENEFNTKDWRTYVQQNGKDGIEHNVNPCIITYNEENKRYVLWKIIEQTGNIAEGDRGGWTVKIKASIIQHKCPYDTVWQFIKDVNENDMFDYDDAIAVSLILTKEQHLWREWQFGRSRGNIRERIKRMTRLSKELCVKKEVSGDKLIDVNVIGKKSNNIDSIEGIQFKFLMYS